jgi:hypothetical protein
MLLDHQTGCSNSFAYLASHKLSKLGEGQGRPVCLGHEQPLQHNLVEVAVCTPDQEAVELQKTACISLARKSTCKNSCCKHTFTSNFRYTLSLLGAVLAVFLLRPPAIRSIPCNPGTTRNETPHRLPTAAASHAHAPWLLILSETTTEKEGFQEEEHDPSGCSQRGPRVQRKS